MTIVRRWSGLIRTADRDAYVRYVAETGGDDYARCADNLGAEIHTRDLGDGTSEVVTLSWWSSLEAIERFAGKDVARARYYPQDDQYLLRKPRRVAHFDVTHRVWK